MNLFQVGRGFWFLVSGFWLEEVPGFWFLVSSFWFQVGRGF